MPLPLLFIGMIAASGSIGVGSTVKAGLDQNKYKQLNSNTSDRLDSAVSRMEHARIKCRDMLESLGEEKFDVLQGNLRKFVDLYSRLKNVDLKDTPGIDELNDLHIDVKEFQALTQVSGLESSLAIGVGAGATGGAITALGAYGAAGALAHASTGTAIATLSGAAAKNATLAFFGGGAKAIGGLGIVGGQAILGGLVAGPAVAVMGTVLSAKAGKNLENAKKVAADADVTIEQIENGIIQCTAIRRRTAMFYTLLAHLDTLYIPLLSDMADILRNEGIDYSRFTPESKKKIASAASMAVTIKSILDTPLLDAEGELTQESGALVGKLTAG